METCQFSYIQRNTVRSITALGVERSWEQLQAEFNRDGPGLSGATYYKTISFRGPELFAVVNEECVFYHDKGQWQRYLTATDIKIGIMNIMSDELERAKTDEQSQSYFKMTGEGGPCDVGIESW